MTKKQKTLMKSMLNYYEIDTDGTRNEKMNTEDRRDFLEKFNRNYDIQIIQDVMKKVRDNIKKNFQQSEEEMRMMDEMEDMSQRDIFEEMNTNDIPPVPHDDEKYKTEVDEFINWLSNLLHQTNHKVIVTQDGLNTTIQLLNLKSGKKK